MYTPMSVDAMMQVSKTHQRELRKDAEQRRLARIALAARPRRSIVEQIISAFRHEQPAVEVIVETTEAAVVDAFKTQPLKAIRRTEELRRAFYEQIRQGNAMQELEEQAEHQWQVGGA